MPEQVKITARTEGRWDEWYALTFKCPKCDSYNIMKWFKFCPVCGVALYFTKGALENAKR